MPRYFVAVEPPRDELAQIANVMREMGDPWPVPHITLKAPDGLTPDLEWLPKVREVAARSARFEVTIGPARTFDDRVLYLSVQSTNLALLHQSILEIVAPDPDLIVRYSEDREYVPHLTLAIAHHEKGLPPYEDLVLRLRDLDPFEAVDLTVFRREDLSTHYQAWKRLPLATPHES